MTNAEAIETLRANYPDACFEQLRCAVDMAIKALVKPQHKKGNWIDKGWNGDWHYQMDGRGTSWHEWQCSECNHITKGAKWNFCPKCGADMRGE